MNIKLSIYIFLVCMLLSSCDSLFGYVNGDFQEGIVVDAETGEPISDAFVIGQWSTSGIERTICFHLAMTRSDESGKFILPAWRIKSKFRAGDKSVALHSYKAGYHQEYTDPNGHLYLDNRLRLVKLGVPIEDKESRIAVMREAARQISCRSAGQSEKNVEEFYQALYEEALAYAGGEIFEDILFLRELVERHELGIEKASERYQASLRALRSKGKGQQLPETRIIETIDEFARGSSEADEENN